MAGGKKVPILFMKAGVFFEFENIKNGKNRVNMVIITAIPIVMICSMSVIIFYPIYYKKISVMVIKLRIKNVFPLNKKSMISVTDKPRDELRWSFSFIN